MRNIKLIIEYDGTAYHGWQKQPKGRTIQEEIEKAVGRITGEEVKIIGSGRTDRGVHARGQVANFHTESNVPSDRFKFAINSLLPQDISVIVSEAVDNEFNSRYSAKGKEYRYLVYNSRVRSPLHRNYSYHIPYEIDIDNIKKALNYFIGIHDFSGFMSSGSSVKDTVRRIYSFTMDYNDSIIDFRIRGNGFLYNMVRIIVGTLIDVGSGKINHKDIPDIIASKQRSRAGHTAGPHGLYLEKVFYDEEDLSHS